MRFATVELSCAQTLTRVSCISMEGFRAVLLLVRQWAKRRSIYGPTFGFPAGISWAVMTAAACQRLPPDTPPSDILRVFFALLVSATGVIVGYS